MGVYSVLISSTATIRQDDVPKALATLRKSASTLPALGDQDLELCTSLPEALEKLNFDFEIVDGDITQIGFSDGYDYTIIVMPILAPFVEEGGEIVMEHDDERQTLVFSDGSVSAYIDEEEYEDDEDDEYDSLCDEADALFDAIRDDELTAQLLADAIEAQGNADFTDGYGDTPLTAILDRQQLEEDEPCTARDAPPEVEEAVGILLRAGADLNKANDDGYTAVVLALSAGYFNLASRLADAGAKFSGVGGGNAFEAAARRLSREALDFLIARQLDFAEHGGDTLNVACAHTANDEKKLAFVEHLVETLGADVNLPAHQRHENFENELRKQATPLMAAAAADDPIVLAYLLERGADPKAVDSAGNTALHYCSGSTWAQGEDSPCWEAGPGNLDVVRLLLDDVSAIGARNRSNKSPYDLAKEENPQALALFRERLAASGATMPIELSDDLEGEITYHQAGGMGYTLNFKAGKLHGVQKFLNASGGLLAQVEYRDGLAHGAYHCWREDGSLMFEAACVDGEWDGEVNVLGESGEAVQTLRYNAGRRHGQQLLLNDEGGVLIQAEYVDGKKHGRFLVKGKEGKVVVDEVFTNDEPAPRDPPADKKPVKSGGLLGVFASMLGSVSTGSVAALAAEERLQPPDKLFFHQPRKVLLLFEKTQARRLP